MTIVVAVSCLILVPSVVPYLYDLYSDYRYRRTAEALFEEVSDKLELVRGFAPEGAELKIVTADWVRENWAQQYVESVSEEIIMEEEIYKALFLISEDVSLREIKVQQEVFMAAKWGDDIYIVKEYFDPFNKESAIKLFAHELTHVVQARFEPPERYSHDGKQAWWALIEGDADMTAKMYIKRFVRPPSPIPALTVMPLLSSSASRMPLWQSSVHKAGVPDSLTLIDIFPYQYGEGFVRALFDDGGWRGVNRVYRDPPMTTEQIMHPERYLDGEGFVEADVPSLKRPDWTVVKTERFGEHFIFVMLDAHIPREEAAEAAEGWGGDNFTYYKRGEDYLFTWKIVWDTEQDAVQFNTSLFEMMEELDARQMEPSIWKVRGRYVSFIRERNISFIVGSSDKASLKLILPQLYRLNQ